MLLPRPLPDEIIGSVIARACKHTGLPLKAALMSLFGGNRSYCSFLMVPNVGRVATMAGMPPKMLLLEHTIFPYSVAFMTRREQGRLMAKALRSPYDMECLGALTKNVSHGIAYRRFCEQCAKEDLEHFGETYWRRMHQLPCTFICPWHGIGLRESNLAIRGRTHSGEIRLPHEVCIHRPLPPLNPRIALELVEESKQAMTLYAGVGDRSLEYREWARCQGFIKAAHEVAGTRLADAIRIHFGAELLAAVGCPIPHSGRRWPGLMVQPNAGVPFASTKHVLLRAFFTGHARRPLEFVSPRTLPGPKTRDYARLDMIAVECLAKQVEKLRLEERRMTVKQILVDARVWQAFRHHREAMPKTRAFIAAFRTSDQAERQLGGRPYWRARLPKRFVEKKVEKC